MRYVESKNRISGRYKVSVREWGLYGGMGAGGAFLVLEIFYRSLWLSMAAAAAAGILFPLCMRGELLRKNQRKMTMEFKEILYNLSSALRVGRSLESAFEASCMDMSREEYPQLYDAWRMILARLRLHQRLEDLLLEFAVSVGIDEIISFAQVIAVSKRTEGDVAKIIENTAQLIQEKIEMQQELDVLLVKKKMEQRILNCMPFLVMGFLIMLSPDYVEPLYTTIQGRLVMTVCVIVSIISIASARKIADISF